MRATYQEAVEKAVRASLEDVSSRHAQLDSLLRQTEGYTDQPLAQRMQTAARVFKQFISPMNGRNFSEAAHSLPEETDTPHTELAVLVGYQPEEWAPGYGDTSELKRHEKISAKYKVQVEGSIPRLVNIGELIFENDWDEEGVRYRAPRVYTGNRITTYKLETRPLDTEEDGELIDVIDRACLDIVERKLTPQVRLLGTVAVDNGLQVAGK